MIVFWRQNLLTLICIWLLFFCIDYIELYFARWRAEADTYAFLFFSLWKLYILKINRQCKTQKKKITKKEILADWYSIETRSQTFNASSPIACSKKKKKKPYCTQWIDYIQYPSKQHQGRRMHFQTFFFLNSITVLYTATFFAYIYRFKEIYTLYVTTL